MKARTPSRRNAGVARNPGNDMSPMLDVIFQLVLFFLVSTTFAIVPGIAIRLPQSETAAATPAPSLRVTLAADGRLWLNDAGGTTDSFRDLLNAADTGVLPRADIPVTLDADADVPYALLVSVIDALRQEGFATLTLHTSARTARPE